MLDVGAASNVWLQDASQPAADVSSNDAWVLDTPPRFVLPLAGPYGALLILAIAWMSFG